MGTEGQALRARSIAVVLSLAIVTGPLVGVTSAVPADSPSRSDGTYEGTPPTVARSGPACGKAPGSVSGDAVPVWVDFTCVSSSNQSATVRIDMRQAWAYVVRIHAPPDAAASDIVINNSQTVFRHGLPESEIGVWPPLMQKFGPESGDVTVMANFGSALKPVGGTYREKVGVWHEVNSQLRLRFNPGVYRVEVLALKPWVTQAETIEGLSAEEMTQLAVAGADRKRGSLTLEVGGCVAGYDPNAHLDTLEQQGQDLRRELARSKRKFQALAESFGVSMGLLAATLTLSGMSMAGVEVTLGGTVITGGTGSTVESAANIASAANDGLSMISGAMSINQAKRLARQMLRTRKEIVRNLKQQNAVLDSINRCYGGGYVAAGGGGS